MWLLHPWLGFSLHSFIPSPCGTPVRKMEVGRSMDSLISPKGNQKKAMQYEQTHKIFLCFFGEYLMHIRSGLCNVNFRVVGKKDIILKSNVVLFEKKLWFTEKGCWNTPVLNQYLLAWRCRSCWVQEMFCVGCLGHLAEAEGSLQRHPLFLRSQQLVRSGYGSPPSWGVFIQGTV